MRGFTINKKGLLLWTSIIIIIIFITIIIFKEDYYATIRYPDGKIKKISVYLPFKKVFRIKEFYPSGELESIGYVSPTGPYQIGEGKIFSRNGNLIAINLLDSGRLYYKKVYKYDKSNYLVDSADALIPIIREFKLNVDRDTAIIKAQVIVKDTKYKYEDLDLFFEVYDTIQPDGIFPYTPTDSTIFNSPEVKTILFPIVPIAKNPKKFYLGMVIREKVNGEKVEHEPVVREIELK